MESVLEEDGMLCIELCGEDESALRFDLLVRAAKHFERDLSNRAEAIECLVQALLIRPEDSEALARLGVLYTEERPYTEERSDGEQESGGQHTLHGGKAGLDLPPVEERAVVGQDELPIWRFHYAAAEKDPILHSEVRIILKQVAIVTLQIKRLHA